MEEQENASPTGTHSAVGPLGHVDGDGPVDDSGDEGEKGVWTEFGGCYETLSEDASGDSEIHAIPWDDTFGEYTDADKSKPQESPCEWVADFDSLAVAPVSPLPEEHVALIKETMAAVVIVTPSWVKKMQQMQQIQSTIEHTPQSELHPLPSTETLWSEYSRKRRSAILVLLVSIGVRVARRAFVLVAGAQSGKAEIRTTDAGNRTYSERRVASHPGLFGSERAH